MLRLAPLCHGSCVARVLLSMRCKAASAPLGCMPSAGWVKAMASSVRIRPLFLLTLTELTLTERIVSSYGVHLHSELSPLSDLSPLMRSTSSVNVGCTCLLSWGREAKPCLTRVPPAHLGRLASTFASSRSPSSPSSPAWDVSSCQPSGHAGTCTRQKSTHRSTIRTSTFVGAFHPHWPV